MLFDKNILGKQNFGLSQLNEQMSSGIQVIRRDAYLKNEQATDDGEV